MNLVRSLLVVGAVVSGLASCGAPERCSPVNTGGAFCVPDSGFAPANTALTLQIIDQCSGGCGRTSLACSVSRDAGTVTLAITGEVCQPPPNVACTAACALTRLPCEVPALAEGDYTVVAPNQAPQSLKVGADAGTVAACSAPIF
jgi:hypothetical protein